MQLSTVIAALLSFVCADIGIVNALPVTQICHSGYLQADDGGCYAVLNAAKEKMNSWFVAATMCTASNGKLVTLTEENFLAVKKLAFQEAEKRAVLYYVDGNNILSDSWLRGTDTLDATDPVWAVNQPDSTGDRHCAALSSDGVIAAECTNRNPALRFGVICEMFSHR